MIEGFKSYLASPDGLRLRQWAKMGVPIVGGAALMYGVLHLFERPPALAPPALKSSRIDAPLASVEDKDTWLSKMDDKYVQTQQEVESLKQEIALGKKQVDVLQQLMQKKAQDPEVVMEQEFDRSLAEVGNLNPNHPMPTPSPAKSTPFLVPNFEEETQSKTEKTSSFKEGKVPRQKSKMGHLKLSAGDVTPIRNASTYIPAGTFSRAVLLSGVVASTATNAQGNPQPIVVRLADSGNLPRGFKGDLKDAMLIGACYGDLSSERALCRLHTLSWIERNGETVEREVEGWLIGEDGRPGLKGQVVDRAGDVARESLIAGILSGMGKFLQFEANQSVFPATPFGQTSGMRAKDALTGAAGGGVSNALDKLAEFSIKRAEQMQPVIVVSSGRIVDVVFKKGIDLTRVTNRSTLNLVTASTEATLNPSSLGENLHE